MKRLIYILFLFPIYLYSQVPSIPILQSPANYTTIITNGPIILLWGYIPGATEYTLYIGSYEGNMTAVATTPLNYFSITLPDGIWSWSISTGNNRSAVNYFTKQTPPILLPGYDLYIRKIPVYPHYNEYKYKYK